MTEAAENANTSEVITHERFLSATRNNIKKFKELKHHRACNKLNEITGRRERLRSSSFYQLVEKTSLDGRERRKQQGLYPLGQIPNDTKTNTNHVTPSITLVTQNPNPNPAPPPTQTQLRVNDHPPHVTPTEQDHPTHVIPEVSNPITRVNPTEQTSHPASAIPVPSPAPHLATMPNPNVCTNVSADSLPRKKKLPPGHPKGKMVQQEEEQWEQPPDLETSYLQSTNEHQIERRTTTAAPVNTGQEQTETQAATRIPGSSTAQEHKPEEREKQQQVAATAQNSKHPRAAATAPGYKAENTLNKTISQGTQMEDQKHWPSYVPTMAEGEMTPRRPATKNIPEILNLSKKPLTEIEREVLSLGLRFAPTARKTPDPLEYFDKYQDQCLRVYNKLAGTRGASKLPDIVVEHLTAAKQRLEKTTETQIEAAKNKWLNMSVHPSQKDLVHFERR